MDVKIFRIINHPQYKAPKKYYDISLLELQTDVKFTVYIQAACLWPFPEVNRIGPKATVTGWGVVDTSKV